MDAVSNKKHNCRCRAGTFVSIIKCLRLSNVKRIGCGNLKEVTLTIPKLVLSGTQCRLDQPGIADSGDSTESRE